MITNPRDDREATLARIAELIRERTHGRVTDLRVLLDGGVVILSGRSRTQYAKQLALSGALDLLPDRPITNAIAVESPAGVERGGLGGRERDPRPPGPVAHSVAGSIR